MSLTDDFVLCTRNRAALVRTCLAAVMAQDRVPDVVIIVDSSDAPDTWAEIESLSTRWPAASRLRYHHTSPGLPHQRRVGIEHTTNDIVHFLDDDSIAEPGYFGAIVERFAADVDGAVLGVGGFITNQPEHRLRRIDEWLGLDSRIEGSVLASGRNIRVHREPPGEIDVDWLPGCSMSYRRSALEVELPNADVPFHSEDVDLSYRVRQHGRLVLTPNARLRHEEVAEGRLAGAPLVEREIVARWDRVRRGTGAYSARAFRRSLWGQLLRYGLPAVVTRRPARLEIARGTWAGVRAIR